LNLEVGEDTKILEKCVFYKESIKMTTKDYQY